jgi:hypothetical protein
VPQGVEGTASAVAAVIAAKAPEGAGAAETQAEPEAAAASPCLALKLRNTRAREVSEHLVAVLPTRAACVGYPG